MGKRITAIFLVLVVFVFGVSVSAESEFEYKQIDGAAAVSKYNGSSEKAEIPEKTDDGEVRMILSGAFEGNKELKGVVIPESVVKIEENVFNGCENLQDIYFNGSMESWKRLYVEGSGNESFINAKVHFMANGEMIYESEFFRYRINGDNEIIVCSCLDGYKENTKIIFPSEIDKRQVIGIDDGAFEDCGNVSEIKLEEGIRYIGEKAFMNCGELKKISLPYSLEKIGKDAFKNTFFYNESADGNVYIDGWYCGFKGNPVEMDFRVQRGTKGIADFAFYGNKNIVNVFFPKGVKYIGSGAFGECVSLSGIFFEGSKKEWKEISISSGNDSISEKSIRYNITIDNYFVGIYKSLCMVLLVITGVLLALLVYCISKIIVQSRIISYLDEELNNPPPMPPRARPKNPPKRRS